MKIRVRRRILLYATLFFIFFTSFISPVRAQKKYDVVSILQLPELESGADFGNSVAVCEDQVVIGAYRADIGGKRDTGRVYVFDTTGNLQTVLQAPEPEARAWFGYSTAVNEKVIVASAPLANAEDISNSGQVYIFDKEGDLLKSIRSPEPDIDEEFGISVSVSNDFLAIGSYAWGGIRKSKVYVFNTAGTLLSMWEAPGLNKIAGFGNSVAVYEETIAIGEHHASVDGRYGAGRAYIFDITGNLQASLQAPDPYPGSLFGTVVAVSDDCAIIGAPHADGEGISDVGRAYIFELNGTLRSIIYAPDTEPGAYFGNSVAVKNDTIVIGATFADTEEVRDAGRAYIYDTNGTLLTTLQAPIPQVGAEFGGAQIDTLNVVAIHDDIVVIGEHSANVEDTNAAGRAYIFRETPPTGSFISGFPFESIFIAIAAGTVLRWIKNVNRKQKTCA